MGPAVAGLLILGVFFTAGMMMFRSAEFGNVLVATSTKESTSLSGEPRQEQHSLSLTYFAPGPPDLDEWSLGPV